MFIIRKGMKEDCIAIEDMIKEMADYQNLTNVPMVGHKRLEEDGFGDKRYFSTFVAQLKDNDQLIGYVLYYDKYTTWTGRCLWMESLFVRSQYRKLGAGRALMAAVAKQAVDEGLTRLEWDVGSWNHSSIAFYDSFGGINLTQTEDVLMYRLDGNDVKQLANYNNNSFKDNNQMT